MINEAPKQSVGIYQLAKRLGDGNIKDGLSKLLKLAGDDAPPVTGADDEG